MSRPSARISVITASYNRAHLLGRLYASLCAQTCHDFEWLIVDDGSTDETRQFVDDWQNNGTILIRYLSQHNSGKHVAMNRGFAAAQGQFCAVIDSDDWYVENAIERLLYHWDAIDPGEKDRFASIEGLCVSPNGVLVNTLFPRDVFDSDNLDIRFRHRILGDTMGMYRTDILRQFPFPEDLGSFIPEALVWWRIAARYRSRYVNELIGYKEYLPGGLSDQGIAATFAASRAYAMMFLELATTPHGLPRFERMRAAAQYVRYAAHAGIAFAHRFPAGGAGAMDRRHARWHGAVLA